MIKTTRIKYSQAPRIIVDDLSPQCDGVKQTFTLSRPVPEWAPYCLVFNGQLYTNTAYKQWFVLDDDRKTIHTSFITPPTKGPNKSLILIVGVAGMEDLAVDWDDIVNKPEIPTEEVVDAKDAAVLSESKGYTDGKIGDLATVARTGDYDDLSDKPALATVATSGSYNDLSNKPTIPAAQVNSDWNAASGKAQILNKPTLAAVATSGSYNDLSNKPTIPAAQVNSDWNASSGKAQILNKPTLATVATSGSYNDLSNKPTIPAAQVNSDWNASSGKAQILNKPTLAAVATSGSYNDLTNKPTIPSGQIQSDWTQTNTSEVDYIKNKPTLATVATSGSYNDLSNKPTIPTVNNATLTITQNGTSVGTFTANASSNKTIAVTDTTYSNATTSASGLMSASDKTKLNGIATGAEVNVQSDWNQATTTADDYIKNKPTLAAVATSGDYADLSGTPSVPTFTLQNTDPGEGGTLAANSFIGVYQ